jgi:hypothetical protein
MATRIMHGQPDPSECAVVKVTMIREGLEFEDLDYPDKEEEIEKLKDAKGNFILSPHKYIILKTRSSPIVSPQKREDDGTPSSRNTLPYPALSDLLLHLKILHKLPLLPKIHHLHNLLSIILQSLLSIVLLHMFILQCLLLTLPLLKICQLNKLLNIVLLHMFNIQSLLRLCLFKIHQLNKLFSIILLMFIPQSLLLALPSSSKPTN